MNVNSIALMKFLNLNLVLLMKRMYFIIVIENAKVFPLAKVMLREIVVE